VTVTDTEAREVRCPGCGKLLARAHSGSRLALACPRCRAIWALDVSETALNFETLRAPRQTREEAQ